VLLKPGMFFTIEPMINLGRAQVKVLSDGWTAVTRDRSLSAQFEHTVGITETGVEVLTLSPAGLDRPYARSVPVGA
jgi:methionyl aminopeptidase